MRLVLVAMKGGGGCLRARRTALRLLSGPIRVNIDDSEDDSAREHNVSPSALFIARPVATTLLTFAVALAGFFAFLKLPVAPLPQVDYPTITVNASMPGASPPTMAATVATPLERYLGIIANVVGMNSESSVGITRITLQFSLNRSLDGARTQAKPLISPLGVLGFQARRHSLRPGMTMFQRFSAPCFRLGGEVISPAVGGEFGGKTGPRFLPDR